MKRRFEDPETHFLDAKEYQYYAAHRSFYHAELKFWYVPVVKLFWSMQENQWFRYQSDKWQAVPPPKNAPSGPWKPKVSANQVQKRKRVFSKSVIINKTSLFRFAFRFFQDFSQEQINEAALLLNREKGTIMKIVGKKGKIQYIINLFKGRYKFGEQQARNLYQLSRLQYRTKNDNPQPRNSRNSTSSSEKILKPQKSMSKRLLRPVSVRETAQTKKTQPKKTKTKHALSRTQTAQKRQAQEVHRRASEQHPSRHQTVRPQPKSHRSETQVKKPKPQHQIQPKTIHKKIHTQSVPRKPPNVKASAHSKSAAHEPRKIRPIDLLRKNTRLKKKVENEILYLARKHCKESRGSTVRSWHGKNVEIIRNDIRLIFPELSTLSTYEFWEIISNIRQLCRKKDRVVFDKVMRSEDMLIECIAQVLLTNLPSTVQDQVRWKGVAVHQCLKTSNDVKTFCVRSNVRKEQLKYYLLEHRESLSGIHVERDADQKNVQDFTIWVRFEETQDMENWKTKKIKEAVNKVIGKVKESARSKSEFQRGLSNSMVSREKFPLRDPTTLSRIKIPGKGVRCDHPQCFDIEVYIGAKLFQRDIVIKSKDKGVRKLERWSCPICNKLTEVKDLFVDDFWKEIIADPKTHDVDSIIVFPDCTYQIEELDGEASESDSEGPASSKPAKPKADVIDLISDDEEAPIKKQNEKKTKTGRTQPQEKEKVNQSGTKRKLTENFGSRKKRKMDELTKLKVAETVIVKKATYHEVKHDPEIDGQFLRTFLDAVHLGEYEKSFKEKNIGFRELIKIFHSQSTSENIRCIFGKSIGDYATFLRFFNIVFNDPYLLRTLIVGDSLFWPMSLHEQ